MQKQRNKATLRFEKEHQATICNFNFKVGALILIRNTAIEKSLTAIFHIEWPPRLC